MTAFGAGWPVHRVRVWWGRSSPRPRQLCRMRGYGVGFRHGGRSAAAERLHRHEPRGLASHGGLGDLRPPPVHDDRCRRITSRARTRSRRPEGYFAATELRRGAGVGGPGWQLGGKPRRQERGEIARRDKLGGVSRRPKVVQRDEGGAPRLVHRPGNPSGMRRGRGMRAGLSSNSVLALNYTDARTRPAFGSRCGVILGV